MNAGQELRVWDRFAAVVEFDVDSGRVISGRRTLGDPKTAPTSGFTKTERGRRGRAFDFAVYRDFDDVYFQAGNKRWRVGDPNVRFSHARLSPISSRFRVEVGGAVDFDFAYAHPLRSLVEMLDPTYDYLDLESDFFLIYVADHFSESGARDDHMEGWTPIRSSPLGSAEIAR